MRLFVALDLPDRFRSALAALRADVPGARWVPAENLHVTLHFLGEVAPETAKRLVADVRRLTFAPVSLVPAGMNVFPSLRRPRVLVVQMKHNAPFTALHAATAALIARHGFAPEARLFHPHVTIARLKSPDAVALRAFAGQSHTLPAGIAHRVTLYESALDQRGAQYRSLSTAQATPG